MKYVIWLVIALAVIVWFQRTKKNILHKQNKQNNQGGAAEGAHPHPSSLSGVSPPVEEMVACAQCGLHFPASEAVTDYAGRVFCSDEHRRLHAQ